MNRIQLRDGWALFLFLGMVVIPLCRYSRLLNLVWSVATRAPMAEVANTPSAQGLVIPHSPENELTERLSQWKANRAKLGELLLTMDRDRFELLRKLEHFGVDSLQQASSDVRARVVLEELRGLLARQEKCRTKMDRLELSILKLEAQLRCVAYGNAEIESGLGASAQQDLTRQTLWLEESLAAEKDLLEPTELDLELSQQFEVMRDRPWLNTP